MKKYILILATIACALVACHKNEIELLDKPIVTPLDNGKVSYTFTAVLTDDLSDADTKATVSRAGAFTWVVNDALKFYKTDGTAVDATITAVDGSTATIEVQADDNANFFSAIYPASAAVAKDQITFDARGPIVVSAVTGGTLQFYHIGSLINLKFTDIPTGTASLVFTPATAFGYDGHFSFTDRVPSLTAGGSTTSLHVSASTADEDKDITICVPSVSLTNGFSAALNNAADGTGRNLFKKSTATTRDLSAAPPMLLNMKKVAYEAPNFYYVRTKAANASDVWNGANIMLKKGANEYEVFLNCDANTVSYVYDEYNIGNDETGAGCLAYTAKVNDANKYQINYRSDTNVASMAYVSGTYTYPYNWNNLYSNTLYLRGEFNRSDWSNTSYFSATNTTKPNNLMSTMVTISGDSGGAFGIKAGDNWWSKKTSDGNYQTITAGTNGIYYGVLVKGSDSNESISLPAGDYTVYANILQDGYDDRPIRLMFVKQ